MFVSAIIYIVGEKFTGFTISDFVSAFELNPFENSYFCSWKITENKCEYERKWTEFIYFLLIFCVCVYSSSRMCRSFLYESKSIFMVNDGIYQAISLLFQIL